MFITEWKLYGKASGGVGTVAVTIHYQCPINQYDAAEWSWGPLDGSCLVSISEAHALALISHPECRLVTSTVEA